MQVLDWCMGPRTPAIDTFHWGSGGSLLGEWQHNSNMLQLSTHVCRLWLGWSGSFLIIKVSSLGFLAVFIFHELQHICFTSSRSLYSNFILRWSTFLLMAQNYICSHISEGLTVFPRIYDGFFSFQNNPKDLDPSYKTDLDLWDCFGRVKLVL